MKSVVHPYFFKVVRKGIIFIAQYRVEFSPKIPSCVIGKLSGTIWNMCFRFFPWVISIFRGNVPSVSVGVLLIPFSSVIVSVCTYRSWFNLPIFIKLRPAPVSRSIMLNLLLVSLDVVLISLLKLEALFKPPILANRLGGLICSSFRFLGFWGESEE